MSQRVKDILVDDFWIMPATPEYKDDGIPYITSKNIKNGIIDFTKVNYISQEAYNSISRNRPILVGDILISMIGTLGETAEVKESYGSFYGQNMFLVRINENKINKRYFLDFFKSSSVKRALEGKQNQSTQKYLKANHIEDLTIPMLKLDEQKLIAEQLDKLSYIIKLRTDELKKLDELIKARFVEMFGNENNSKNWNIAHVEEVADVQVGVVIKPSQYYTDESNGIRVFRSLNIGEGFIKDNDWAYFTEEGHQKNSKSILKENDLLIVRSGNPGTACVVTKKYVGYNAIDVIIAHPNCEKVNPYYLCIYTNMPHGKKQIEEGTGGAAQQHFNIGKYNKLKLMMPPKSLQDEFADFVHQVDKSKVAVQKALDETKLLFDSLMQKYFG